MGLLQKAESTTAFFKCGILGFSGAGKTFTAGLLAQGICKSIDNNKIAFLDTETGSDFLLKKLQAENLEVFQAKTRSFSDVLLFLEECEKDGIGVTIIDSITHIWRDLCDAYDKKLHRKGRLQFQDWAVLKGEWKQYTDRFINSALHIIACGRAGYEYDYDYNEDGTKDLIKTGTKMKVESEFGFEPSLVIEMERLTPSKQIMDELKEISDPKLKRQRKQTFKPQIGSKWIHRAHILKDRADIMDGQSFDNPTFENFKPHFDFLNIGGVHLGVDTTRSSEDRFDIEGRPDWKKNKINKDIALEEIQATMVKLWPSTTKDDKQAKADFLEAIFDTRSWVAVQEKSLRELEDVKKVLKEFEINYEKAETKTIDVIWRTTIIGDMPDFDEPGDDGSQDKDKLTQTFLSSIEEIQKELVLSLGESEAAKAVDSALNNYEAKTFEDIKKPERGAFISHLASLKDKENSKT